MTATEPAAAARLWPGFVLVGALTAAAFALRQVPTLASISPLMLAILVGIAWRNIAGAPAAVQPGIGYCLKKPLRFGIALLGLQLTWSQVLQVGWGGVSVLIACVVATFVFTVGIAGALGVDGRLARLIAAGTSICGASAVIAANTVVGDKDEGVAYALAIVTLFGTIAMFVYPLLPGSILDPHAYGLWIGASVHEVAQVVAAGFAHGDEAGQFGTMTKLTRVLMLAPMILALGWLARRAAGAGAAAVPTPWFVFGFIALVAVSSLGWVPGNLRPGLMLLTQVILAISLAAVGLETDFRRIVARGWRPLALGGLATVFIAALAFTLIAILGL